MVKFFQYEGGYSACFRSSTNMFYFCTNFHSIFIQLKSIRFIEKFVLKHRIWIIPSNNGVIHFVPFKLSNNA